ncbi:hypothetical protein GCM10010245_91330 [Streptomyces spectabilis]|nr:hypothetical protein GCM10010245_91330 [Streptomyces spectabilis]
MHIRTGQELSGQNGTTREAGGERYLSTFGVDDINRPIPDSQQNTQTRTSAARTSTDSALWRPRPALWNESGRVARVVPGQSLTAAQTVAWSSRVPCPEGHLSAGRYWLS